MKTLTYAFLIGLAGCSSITQQPADPKVVSEIVSVCMRSGYFKIINGVIGLAVPTASLPISLISAGVDQVCMKPEQYASDAATIDWLIKNFNQNIKNKFPKQIAYSAPAGRY